LEKLIYQSLQLLESPLGAAQTLAIRATRSFDGLKIGIVASLKLTMVQRQQLTGEKRASAI
jgi:hypothetical protein